MGRSQHAGRHREQGRRRRRHRHGLCRESQARRLHAADGAVVDLDHSRSRQGHRARADVPAQPVRPDRAVHRRPDGARGPRREPVEDAAGIRRRRPQAARRDQLRLVGQLRNDAHPDGDVRGERRSQAAARALHRRRARRGRAARRHRRRDLDRPFDGDPARQGRQGARAGVVGRQAARGAARRPDADGIGIQRRSSSSGRRCSLRRERRSRRSSSCAMPRAPPPPIRGSSPRWRRWRRRSSISTRRSCSASGKPTRRSSAKRSGAWASSSRPRAQLVADRRGTEKPRRLPCGAEAVSLRRRRKIQVVTCNLTQPCGPWSPASSRSRHWRTRRARSHRPGSRPASSPSGTGRTRRSMQRTST